MLNPLQKINFVAIFFSLENIVRKPAKFVTTAAPFLHPFVRECHRAIKNLFFLGIKKYDFKLDTQECLEKIQLVKTSSLKIGEPSFLPVELGQKISNHTFLMKHPGVYLIKYEDVSVLPGFHLVFDYDRKVAFHDILYNPIRHSLIGEKNRPTYVSDKSMIGIQTPVAIEMNSNKPIVSLFADANGNFYHFMLETATRAAIASEYKQFSNATFLIEKNLPNNMYTILKALLPETSKLVKCESSHLIKCSDLYYISLPGFCPSEDRLYFEKNILRTPYSNDVSVNLHALKLLKNKLRDPFFIKSSESNFQKIYLIRTSAHRKLINRDKIVDIAKEKGFTIIDPDKFHWRELFNMCASADQIIIEAGAAMLNLLFAEKTVKVFVLSPFILESTYSVHHNIMEAAGLDVKFLIGLPKSNGKGHHVHVDFEINEKTLIEALSAY